MGQGMTKLWVIYTQEDYNGHNSWLGVCASAEEADAFARSYIMREYPKCASIETQDEENLGYVKITGYYSRPTAYAWCCVVEVAAK